jgi:hypothetical protein
MPKEVIRISVGLTYVRRIVRNSLKPGMHKTSNHFWHDLQRSYLGLCNVKRDGNWRKALEDRRRSVTGVVTQDLSEGTEESHKNPH